MKSNKIIIDDVDVSNCDWLAVNHKKLINTGKVEEIKHFCYINNKECENTDCYYKRLKIALQYKKSKQASYEALQKRCNDLEWENRRLKEGAEEALSKTTQVIWDKVCKCAELIDENKKLKQIIYDTAFHEANVDIVVGEEND